MSTSIKYINKHLDKVQANILKPHGRNFVRCLFIQFLADASVMRKWIKDFVSDGKIGVTTAQQQCEASRIYRKYNKTPDICGGLLTCFFLSAQGYRAMDINPSQWPTDRLFLRGMIDNYVCQDFNDPNREAWEDQHYCKDIHAMIFLADNSVEQLDKREVALRSRLEHRGQILFIENGQRLCKDNANLEPFGYRDGMSQPPLWTKNKKWVLKEGCKVVLDDSLGSYLVFRKLQQDVEGFNAKIEALQQALGTSKELAEAQVMGRFKNGTPLTLFERPSRNSINGHRLVKQFDLGKLDYRNDPEGLKCPLHAHIRKTNPRNNLQHLMGSYPTEIHGIVGRIVRNSIPYRNTDQEIGLLFMCYQRSIEVQFRVIQKSWSNDNGGSNPILRGVDPVIGKKWKNQHLAQQWNRGWNIPRSEEVTFDFDDVVKFRGGALLYAPSISFLSKIN